MRDDAGMTHLLLHRMRAVRFHGLDAAVLLLLALGLGSSAGALAQGSLAERRLAITKGTAPGKLLIEAPSATASAPASAAASGAAASSAASPVPTSAAAAASGAAAPARRTGWFSALPPPSGRPLQAARRFDAPDQGIVIKSAQPASAPGR
jgi:hypothetical protein